MQKKIEAMLGAQLFAMAALQEELEQKNKIIADLEARLKKYEPKKKRKDKSDGS